MTGNLAVVILAAGKSTRFKSTTTKLLHTLCGKPMIGWVLDSVLPLNPAQIIVVYGESSKKLLESYSSTYKGIQLDFVIQEPPLGTGHALLQAESKLGEAASKILVLPGDTPQLTVAVLEALIDASPEANGGPAVLTAVAPDPTGYGRIVRGDSGVVGQIVEELDCSEEQQAITEINSGIYLFNRNVFDQLRESAKIHGQENTKGEYYLPQVVELAQTKAVLAGFQDICGVNDRIALAEAENALLQTIRQQWMCEGVTFRLPETTYIEHSVQLAEDVEIGPHCVLTGTTTIGTGTRLVQGCLLESCRIGENCELRHVRGTEAVVGNNIYAGPYVNLRPGTILRDNVKVGNFVETKNSDIGEGSKLPHLQYIGDATLGEGCNIGAGTIFCNYDGFSKKQTKLGDGVFIGSNSSLQGGITIGKGGYVAMGSAITKDVPENALAVGRARQENKLDYVPKLKKRLQQQKDELAKQTQADEGGSK